MVTRQPQSISKAIEIMMLTTLMWAWQATIPADWSESPTWTWKVESPIISNTTRSRWLKSHHRWPRKALIIIYLGHTIHFFKFRYWLTHLSHKLWILLALRRQLHSNTQPCQLCQRPLRYHMPSTQFSCKSNLWVNTESRSSSAWCSNMSKWGSIMKKLRAMKRDGRGVCKTLPRST